MPTVQERYAAATAYVRRAISTVEDRGLAYAIDPITGLVEWYAGKTKTTEPRNELAHIQARWLRATTDDERAKIARDAELLADRVEESLPGAPQDRARTNLYKGETPKGTPATSYAQEVDNQAGEVWGWIKDKANFAANEASSIGKWLLVGGGVVLAWKGVDYLRERERNRVRSASGRMQRALNASLVRVATRSSNGDAPWKVERVSANTRGGVTVEGTNELDDNREFAWYVNKWGINDERYDWSEAQFADQAARDRFDQLARAGKSRNARPRVGYYVRSPDTDLYYRVVRDNGGRYVLLVPLTDDARDAIADHEVYPVTMPDGTEGEGYSADIAHYERVSKLPRWVLQ